MGSGRCPPVGSGFLGASWSWSTCLQYCLRQRLPHCPCLPQVNEKYVGGCHKGELTLIGQQQVRLRALVGFSCCRDTLGSSFCKRAGTAPGCASLCVQQPAAFLTLSARFPAPPGRRGISGASSAGGTAWCMACCPTAGRRARWWHGRPATSAPSPRCRWEGGGGGGCRRLVAWHPKAAGVLNTTAPRCPMQGVLSGLFPGTRTPIPVHTTEEIDEILYTNVKSCRKLHSLLTDLQAQLKGEGAGNC